MKCKIYRCDTADRVAQSHFFGCLWTWRFGNRIRNTLSLFKLGSQFFVFLFQSSLLFLVIGDLLCCRCILSILFENSLSLLAGGAWRGRARFFLCNCFRWRFI